MSSAEEEQELTLIDHLIELRDRILKSAVAVVALFLALFAFSNDIYTYVATPLLDALPEGSTMIAIDPTSPFFGEKKPRQFQSFTQLQMFHNRKSTVSEPTMKPPAKAGETLVPLSTGLLGTI